MAREQYRDINFKDQSLERIALCNTIIAEYGGMKLTLRQLYYQLVSRNVVPNTEKSYKSLGGLISDARLAGLIDWDAIEDRNRSPIVWAEYENVQELVEESVHRFRLPRWEGQSHYAELWVEKAALAGVLRPLAAEYHAPLMVNRGYSSQSAMYECAQRIIASGAGRDCIVFYLGDHDPSGKDMVRDIQDRLIMFNVPEIEVRAIALTTAQVRQFKPPPNPTKVTDSRAAKYIEEFGHTCWEVDALNPRRLETIIRAAFDSIIDREVMDAVIAKEKVQAEALKDLTAKLVRDLNENEDSD